MPVGNPGLLGNSALYAAPENGAVRGSKSSVLWVWAAALSLWRPNAARAASLPDPH